MAAPKLAIRVSQLVHIMATKYTVPYLCVQGPAIQWNWWHYSMTKPEETKSGKSKMVASKLEIRVSQHVHKMGTKFLALYLGFRCSTVQWD